MKRLILAAITFLATGLYGQAPPPPPTITNLSPSSTLAGSPAFGAYRDGNWLSIRCPR